MQITQARSLEGRSAARMPRYCIENEGFCHVGKDVITSSTAWNVINSCGAFLSSAVVADTYDTIVELTGTGGYLTGLVGPRAGTAGSTTTFKITLDSRVEEFDLYNRGTASRVFVGGLVYLFNGTGYPATWPDYDPVFSGDSYGQVGVSNSGVIASLLLPSDVIGQTRKAARFEGYCKVEIKHTVNVAVSGENAKRGAMYAIDGN